MTDQSSLFDSGGSKSRQRDHRSPSSGSDDTLATASTRAPLAERLRPTSLDDVIGQDQLVGEGAFLRRAIEEDRVPSLILWGPPGTGKTTLARIVARQTSMLFVPFSAVTSGIKEIKDVMGRADRRGGRPLLLFVDEIHRFNKAQQDAFLPFVERGDVVLVGATTENPSFELNGALLSRCRVLVLQPLDQPQTLALMRRALADRERGLGGLDVEVDDEALAVLAQLASGDGRRALAQLELIVEDAAAAGRDRIDRAAVETVLQRKVLLYDKSGEEHFNLISALHKSLRESDPDASVYWLMRMLEAGEEPKYVARRLLRFASEDVGLADPRAMEQTLAAWQSFERVGLPEGLIFLTQATLYLALAPKSVATYEAEKAARHAVAERPAEPVPLAIRNAPTQLMKDVGYAKGYEYAPETETGLAGLQCLPDGLRNERFYHPRETGFERRLAERLTELDELRRKARARLASDD